MNIYKFKKKDLLEALKFTTEYHMEETKQSRGRTNSGERGYGGELDSFISGKLTEHGVSEILKKYSNKNFSFEIDNEIYTDSEIGKKSDPDIISVTNLAGDRRKPKIHIEIKKINEELEEWVGMRGDQYDSLIKSKKNFNDKNMYIINASLTFSDNNSRKGHDIVGSLLKELISPKKTDPLSRFSDYKNLTCKINYIYSMHTLKEFGVFYQKGTIMTSPKLSTGKSAYKKDGNLAKGFKSTNIFPMGSYQRAYKLQNTNQKEFFSDWIIEGSFELLKFGKQNNEYLHLKEDTKFSNKFFGDFHFKKNETVKFFFVNKLRTTKSIDDYWFARERLNQLINEKKIPSLEENIIYILKNI